MKFFLRALFYVFCLAVVTESPASAQTGTGEPITNAGAADLQAIRTLCANLDQAVGARDANTLRFYGVTSFSSDYPKLRAETRLTHVAVNGGGALVRQSYRVYASHDNQTESVLLSTGAHELWLSKAADGSYGYTNKYWNYANDTVARLTAAAREEWDNLPTSKDGTGKLVAIDATTDAEPPAVLHLVAQERGGRWLALRRSHWDGAVLDPQRVARLEANGVSVANWLQQQLGSFVPGRAGTAHFMLQRGTRGWVGLQTVWEPSTRISAEQEAAAANGRRQMQGVGYLNAPSHVEFANALAGVGLYAEADDELQKAECLQNGSVGANRLREAQQARERDPLLLNISLLKDEAKVGLGSDHPTYVLNELARTQRDTPTALGALRIGLEYSKLADDQRAGAWLREAERLAAQTNITSLTSDDGAWIKVLSEHLRERERISRQKPLNILRSALFTVRCWSNDLTVLPLLAALETAQHRVYSDFAIPMGSTEVVLWRNQSEFQNYTAKFSQQGISEFVAALTLTKLIDTREGPMVLGEEINVFSDQRTNIFSTVAHEYGHVAVRHMSKGRLVPVWLNEGIATAVEGGYDGYLPRVHRAAEAGQLLNMREMLKWDVDGERAFLAYSQANSIIDYIVEQPKWGRAAVLEILRQLGRDVAPDEAFVNVIGISQYELWNQWSRSGIK